MMNLENRQNDGKTQILDNKIKLVLCTSKHNELNFDSNFV